MADVQPGQDAIDRAILATVRQGRAYQRVLDARWKARVASAYSPPEAVAQANRMRDAKIAEHESEIARLRGMKF